MGTQQLKPKLLITIFLLSIIIPSTTSSQMKDAVITTASNVNSNLIVTSSITPSSPSVQPQPLVSTPLPPLTSITPKLGWTQTSMRGTDLGMSPEGDLYVAGLDRRLYSYNFATSSYTRVIADPDLENIVRVDVDGEGTPIVKTNCGSTYYLSCDNRWIQLPGCATDIGAGDCGQIWKTGCDPREGGFGVWKLFCTGTSTGSSDKCNRYRQLTYSPNYGDIERKKCYWYRVPGAGVRVSVFPDGKPAVIQSNGSVVKYNGNYWDLITKIKGRDLAVSNESMVVLSGVTCGLHFIPFGLDKEQRTGDDFFDMHFGYSNFGNEEPSPYSKDNTPIDYNTQSIDVGCTMAVASGPFSQPSVIPCIEQYDPVVVLSQKFNYN